MSRFFIITTMGSTRERSPALAELTYGERAAQSTGCAWLFTASAEVGDTEAALRAAVIDYFESMEGVRVREGEEMVSIGWQKAMAWVPDEVWLRYGLTVLRHPDVERIVLDDDEDLAEELGPKPPRGAIKPMPSAG